MVFDPEIGLIGLRSRDRPAGLRAEQRDRTAARSVCTPRPMRSLLRLACGPSCPPSATATAVRVAESPCSYPRPHVPAHRWEHPRPAGQTGRPHLCRLPLGPHTHLKNQTRRRPSGPCAARLRGPQGYGPYDPRLPLSGRQIATNAVDTARSTGSVGARAESTH